MSHTAILPNSFVNICLVIDWSREFKVGKTSPMAPLFSSTYVNRKKSKRGNVSYVGLLEYAYINCNRNIKSIDNVLLFTEEIPIPI